MSKLTFRADDDLVERLEELDTSKSQVMREALREYLGESASRPEHGRGDRIDGFSPRTVADLVEERMRTRSADRDVNIDISIEGAPGNEEVSDGPSPTALETTSETEPPATETADPPARQHDGRAQCSQCGESIDSDHVYCPNCGEKRSRRVFCECGDELRTDWSFCPGCGRRTPAADVLDHV